MSTSSGCIRVCRFDQAVAFAVIGQGSMHDCPSLRQAADEALSSGMCSILVDLSRCSYIDSTFVGTLISLRSAAAKRPGGEFAVIRPSCECRELFEQMGIDRLLCIDQRELPPQEQWSDLPEHFDPKQFRRELLTAHEELAKVPGKTGAVFGPVAKQMRKEWESQEGDSH